MALSGSNFNVTANFMDEACQTVCGPASFPVADMLQFALLPAACRECIVIKGWEAIRAGRQTLSFFATLAQAKAFLGDMVYQVNDTRVDGLAWMRVHAAVFT